LAQNLSFLFLGTDKQGQHLHFTGRCFLIKNSIKLSLRPVLLNEGRTEDNYDVSGRGQTLIDFDSDAVPPLDFGLIIPASVNGDAVNLSIYYSFIPFSSAIMRPRETETLIEVIDIPSFIIKFISLQRPHLFLMTYHISYPAVNHLLGDTVILLLHAIGPILPR